MKKRQALILIASVAFSTPVFAECDLSQVVGYTLVAEKTVVAQIEKGKRTDEFTGCDFDRILVFDDNTGVRCNEYNYDYDFRPDAYIFVRASSIKVCISGDFYDVMALR